VNSGRLAALAAAIAVSLAAAACGSTAGKSAAPAPPSPAVLARQAKAAVQEAKSVHIGGSLSQSGKTLGMNLSMTRAGGISGQLSVAGAGFTVLTTHGSSYIKVTSAFVKYLKLPASACVLMCGKFLKAAPAQSRRLVGDLSMSHMLGSLNSPAATYRYRGTATVNGQPAWVLHVSDGSTAYIAAHGKPYPLRLVAPHHRGHLNFTRWNAATIPGPPPANQVVDLSQLAG
jgi:hypothetical protein